MNLGFKLRLKSQRLKTEKSPVQRQDGSLEKQGKGGDPGQKGPQGQIFVHLREVKTRMHEPKARQKEQYVS